MPLWDLPLSQLAAYRPDLPEPDGLDEFWRRSLADAQEHEVAATFRPVDSGLTAIESFDGTFRGYGGEEISCWLHLPAHRMPGARLPGIAEYVGYGGGRGLVHERLLWAAAGYAHLIMDTRGQGSSWSVGDTSDASGSGPAHPGFLTKGLLSPETFYYRRLFVDAVRAVQALRQHPAVDPDAVVAKGISQGGGVAIAVAALQPNAVAAVLPDVPFLSDFPRATTITNSDPYGEVARYLKAHRDDTAQAFRTLSYFDVATLGRRATAPALFSVALMDNICPPSTVYAAYNNYGGPHEIRVYPFNDHEGGQAFQEREQIRWLRETL